MRRIFEYAETQPRTKIFLAVCLLAVLLAMVLATIQTRPADANNSDPCPTDTAQEGEIVQAIEAVTGNTPGKGACNPKLYNNGQWADFNQLKGYVSQVMNCGGNSQANHNRNQAVLEVTGELPLDSVCLPNAYEKWVTDTFGPNVHLDWNTYKGDTINTESAYSAVKGTLSMCSDKKITQAVLKTTGQQPKRGELSNPSVGGSPELAQRGQCNYTLYNHNAYYDYQDLLKYVNERYQSTTNCSDPLITQAYQDLSGWKPLPSECTTSLYGGGPNGHWSTYQELQDRIYNSWRCVDPWIGQVYALEFGASSRRVNGLGDSGECNKYLYNHGDWSDYNDLKSKMGVTKTALESNNLSFSQSGNGALDTPNGRVPALQVLIGAPEGKPSDTVTNGAGDVLSNTGLISQDGGSSPATVISNDGSSLISQDGGSLISQDGGSFTPQVSGLVAKTK